MRNPVRRLPHAAWLASVMLAAVSGASAAQGTPTQIYGQATIALSPGSLITWSNVYGNPNAVTLQSPVFVGTPSAQCAPDCSQNQTYRSVTATFQADPGLIFDRVYIGLRFGTWGNFAESSSSSSLEWTINGGSYSGIMASDTPCAYQGSDYRCWVITGASTGVAVNTGYYWFGSRYGTDIGLPGFYDVQASSFSIDLLQYVTAYNPGAWGAVMEPLGMTVGLSYIDAPDEIATAPEPSTVGLLGLGMVLVGFTQRRRRMKSPTTTTTSAARVLPTEPSSILFAEPTWKTLA